MENNNIKINEPRGPWKAFAIAGFVHGIVALATFFIPIWGLVLGIEGLVFSCLGKRSVVENQKARIGIGLNIAAIVVGFIWIFVYFALIAGVIVLTQTH